MNQGQFGFDENLQSCSIVDVGGKSSKTALFILGFLIPCITIVVCYANIFWVVRRSENRMRKHSSVGTSAEAESRKGRTGSDWRVTKMVLAIFLAFVICYLPITIIKVADKKVAHPNIHILSYVFIYLSSCINPIIYVIMNRQYRQAYQTLLCSRWGLNANYFSTTHAAAEKSNCHAQVGTVVSNFSVAPQPASNSNHSAEISLINAGASNQQPVIV